MPEVTIQLKRCQIDAFIEPLLGKPIYNITDVRVDGRDANIRDGGVKILVVRSQTATRDRLVSALKDLKFQVFEDGK